MRWLRIIDYEDYEVSSTGLVRSNRGRNINKLLKIVVNSRGYQQVTLINDLGRISKSIHRLVVENFKGYIPDNFVVHHIDHNKLNNCIDNLAVVTVRKNSQLRKHKPFSGLTGVYKNSEKWIATVRVDNKLVYLGRFECKYQAEKYYIDYCKANQLK